MSFATGPIVLKKGTTGNSSAVGFVREDALPIRVVVKGGSALKLKCLILFEFRFITLIINETLLHINAP